MDAWLRDQRTVSLAWSLSKDRRVHVVLHDTHVIRKTERHVLPVTEVAFHPQRSGLEDGHRDLRHEWLLLEIQGLDSGMNVVCPKMPDH